MGKKEKKERKTKKSKKDKDAPKRAISAFFFYNQERREKLKKEQPNLDNKEIIKTMSAEWNALSDEKKKPYVATAEADKKGFEAEKKAYDAKKKGEGKASAPKKSVKK